MRNTEPPISKSGDDPDTMKVIDENLRRVYAELMEQDVPERFHDLLDRLRATREQK